MAPRLHALLNASGSHRWLHCTAAPLLEENFPDSTSVYAKEGTLAHELCELKLQKYTTAMAKSTYTRKFNKIKKMNCGNQKWTIPRKHTLNMSRVLC